ncbi:MAG TPA: succinate dehydrogenase, hydrophobic membrane anchor protein [Acidiphilium sp.]|jgi:succinate dehydrogenase / fumarate reductase membrane anchor subunit|uniref:succinate dehydrogenase, hydrophobic membrane anchor protein n=1 Tax=unclassified Acidiphilium TaxID=2617493 RepID=UPI000BC3F95B|nr:MULTISPECIES: succinate dehydrogenase, hydrophobic membrane anchor protein [unclassified Acidiphilium]OYV57695.1 MAG: succinate dehydrogenase, hydrophobic membrane anchor protein [Acidiphilium sp. 20-67-58]OYV85782.1 MAG: succinate dehydrogenase, hydrophobic membrane anchor protein [Acidiphilium sp. 21-68-69]HQT59993.1 succinate dehydrogenase, hydrophobic membrane anchor protein [Acidiphilium sp.]HQU11213.1 succinate dehydrogenase, hydrophobic membrane anchor protein [Acidiphilium sp.]
MKIMRSALGRARGMGAAKAGVHHWWVQRLTALALLPLALYAVLSVLLLKGATQAEMLRYMAEPWNGVLFLALVIALFYHLQLGLQVVIEDYIRSEGKRLTVMLAMRATAGFFGLLAVISVLKLSF